jgi:uncharacterized membrane protein
VKNWLPYIGAFAFGLGGAAMAYFASFYALMSGQRVGFGGFLIVIFAFPTMVGLVSFGVTHHAFAKQSFHWQQWVFGVGFVAITAGICFALLTTQTVPPFVGVALFVTTLFFGGHYLIQRATNG